MTDETQVFDREVRLDEIIAAYLRAVTEGNAPSEQELLQRHPDLAHRSHALWRRQGFRPRPRRRALRDGGHDRDP